MQIYFYDMINLSVDWSIHLFNDCLIHLSIQLSTHLLIHLETILCTDSSLALLPSLNEESRSSKIKIFQFFNFSWINSLCLLVERGDMKELGRLLQLILGCAVNWRQARVHPAHHGHGGIPPARRHDGHPRGLSNSSYLFVEIHNTETIKIDRKRVRY